MYNESKKLSIYNWRLNNEEHFRNYVNTKNLEYYKKHREKILAQKKEYYKRKKLNLQTQEVGIII
jgi:hypothetical protein